MLSSLWTALLITSLACPAENDDSPVARVPALRFVSFNIRFGTANDGENRWELRKDWLIDSIRRSSPDVLGLQETLAFQRDEILAALPGYVSVGVGRQGGERGEMSPILVDTERLEIEDSGTFWLSHSPQEVASKGWDAALPRICTWAKLRDRERDVRFVALNTHFDHRGVRARAESARLISERGADFAGLPRVILGDLNAAEDSEPLETFRAAGWRDAFRVQHPDERWVGTFTGFRAHFEGAKIDYVLCDDRWEVRSAWIDRTQRDGLTPSDHCAVGADLIPAVHTPLMPVLAGDFHRISNNPDLGELTGENQEVVDHGLWRADDGKWQLWACIRGTQVGRVLYRWRGDSLEQSDWLPSGIAMRALPEHGESIDDWGGQEWIQAPFALRHEGGWALLYGGHRTESDACQICLATSEDGVDFERYAGTNGYSRVFVGPGEARDPMVLRVGDRYLCYYTGHDPDARAPCKIYCRSSTDLRQWSRPVAVNWGGSAGSGNWSAECPFVVEHEGAFYLFRTSDYRQPLTHVYRSVDPLDFGRGTDAKKIGTIAVAAPEVVRDGERWLITSVHDLRGGVQIAPLDWAPEREVSTSAAFLQGFEVLWDFEDGTLQGWEASGEAFSQQPTYTEGPAVRGQLVAPSGHWYIGGYEHRPGPHWPANVTRGDEPTGELVSPPFELPAGRIAFRIGGGEDIERLYLALELVGDGEEVRRATGSGHNTLRRVVWDVKEQAGQRARLRLVDRSSDPWGHLSLDEIARER